MKLFILVLILLCLSSCAAITAEQKNTISEYRANEYIMQHYSALGGNEDIRAEILKLYKK